MVLLSSVSAGPGRANSFTGTTGTGRPDRRVGRESPSARADGPMNWTSLTAAWLPGEAPLAAARALATTLSLFPESVRSGPTVRVLMWETQARATVSY